MKIVVVGAGHGGLVAAAKLAQAGHEVHLYERREREALGHPWEDRFTFEVLCDIVGISMQDLPADSWRYRGDCTFISPGERTSIPVHFDADHRQKIMWRRPLIELLLNFAQDSGVGLHFGVDIASPVVEGECVIGVRTATDTIAADLVVDAAGVFSPIRTQLPAEWGIERAPRRGEVFYAYRAYFDRVPSDKAPQEPFEIYLCHRGEQGLSWVCTNEDSVDVLIGRIDPMTSEQVEMELELLRRSHPWLGINVLHGGNGIIPVRRAMPLMVAAGYVAVGDSAFCTTPMNGMGIDLSLQAGALLAQCVAEAGNVLTDTLWRFNRLYLERYAAAAAKNGALKSVLLRLHRKGVDFLFDNRVVQAADLAGGGARPGLCALLGKALRGLRHPAYLGAVLRGIMRGGKASKLYKKAPAIYDLAAIKAWQARIARFDEPIE